MLRAVVSRRSSSEAIALGVAIGVFVAFTPTIGFQMAISAFLATLVGANRAARRRERLAQQGQPSDQAKANG